MTTAFYESDGDSFATAESAGGFFTSSELTRGPWSDEHQHGGPPAALLGRAIARFGADAAEFDLARLTLEFVRPIPLGRLRVEATLIKQGKLVQRLGATLTADGVEVARAVGLRVRRRAIAVPADATSRAPDVPDAESLTSFALPFFPNRIGYHVAVDVRFARGTWGDRDVVVWMRPTVELVAGETASPLERVLVLVDAESGICPPLPIGAFTFVNPDLTLYVERPLEGAWLGLAIRSAAHPNGVGIAESLLFDRGGVLGRSAQSLVVAAR